MCWRGGCPVVKLQYGIPRDECGWSSVTCAAPAPAPGREGKGLPASDRGRDGPRSCNSIPGFDLGFFFFSFSPAMKLKGKGLSEAIDVLFVLSLQCV